MILAPKDLVQRLKAGTVDPVYVFVGEAVFRMGEATHFVVQDLERVKGARPDRFTFSLGDKSTGGVQDILQACNTFNMFGTTQAVVVEDAPLPFPANQKELQALAAYCKAPNPSTVLILRGAPKGYKRGDLGKLEELGCVVWFEEGADSDLARTVLQRARKLGLELGEPEAALIVDRLGTDLGLIQGELERISLTIHPQKRLTPPQLESLIADCREFSVFDLLEPITLKDRKGAVRVVESLLGNGVEPLAVLAVLVNGVRELWAARLVSDTAELRKHVSKPEFVLRKLIDQARRIDSAEFPRMWEALYEAERTLKSSRIPPDEVLFRLIMDCTYGRVS
jgi:DNA polymerase-3 subunit delta